jgi:hypothetical protein
MTVYIHIHRSGHKLNWKDEAAHYVLFLRHARTERVSEARIASRPKEMFCGHLDFRADRHHTCVISWGNITQRIHVEKSMSSATGRRPTTTWAEEEIVETRYQATTGEDTAAWEHLACAVVRSERISESVIITYSNDL